MSLLPFTTGGPRRRKIIKETKLPATSFCLRRMVKRDLPFVLEIETLSFPNPWRPMAFLGEISNFGISLPQVIVLEGEEKVIGYVVCWLIKDEAQIANLAVHPDYRRKGIAEAVMHNVFDRLKADGATFVVLEVRPSNGAAVALYEKLSFSVLGTRKGYYCNPDEDAILMGRIL